MAGRLTHIEAEFPGLADGRYRKSSEQTPDGRYNCIAWAFGDNTKPWWPPGGGRYFWPDDVIDGEDEYTFTHLAYRHGYRPCDGPELEEGYEKVCGYFFRGGNRLYLTHAARQRHDGRWESKIGEYLEDIVHDDPVALIVGGTDYGDTICYFRRPIRSKEDGDRSESGRDRSRPLPLSEPTDSGPADAGATGGGPDGHPA